MSDGGNYENGCFLNSLQVYSLLVLYLLEVRRERGAIVKTITSSNMLDRLGELYGVPVYEVPVGFKYVAPVMINQDAMIGGEESGGYGYRHHIPERDGILSALYFLDYITSTGARPSQLLKMLYAKVGPHYYDRHDYQFPPGRRDVIMQRVSQAEPSRLNGKRVVSNDHVDGYRFKLRTIPLLIVFPHRPLLRIYSRSNSPQEVELLLLKGDDCGI
jgi:phosphomannomutase